MNNSKLAQKLGFKPNYFASMKNKSPERFNYIFQSGEVNEDEWVAFERKVNVLVLFFRSFIKVKYKSKKYQTYVDEVSKHCLVADFERTIRNAIPTKMRITTIKLLEELIDSIQ